MDNQSVEFITTESSGVTDLTNLTSAGTVDSTVTSTLELLTTTASTLATTTTLSTVPTTLREIMNTTGAIIPTVVSVTEALSETTPEEITKYVMPVPVDPFDAELRHSLYVSACWQLAIAIITIGFAIVIAIYGPVVFGSRALVSGMDVATGFLEFCLPVKYEGAPAHEKMQNYTEEQFFSKIRRFAAFIGLAMTVDAIFEFMSGCLGRSGFSDSGRTLDEVEGIRGAFAFMCVLNGLFTFILLVTCLQLFRKGFLREMVLVYAIRNAIACFIFTSAWSAYYNFDFSERVSSAMDDVSNAVGDMTKMINDDN